MNKQALQDYINHVWDESIIAELVSYIRIPNKSPAFDPDWQALGYMDQVVERFVRWARAQPITGMALEVVRLKNRTPLIYMDIPGSSAETVLLYGHLDKQPEMSGWREGLGPWEPVLEGDKLYGRGGADDGYAIFASLSAIAGLQQQGVAHPRCVVIIEACEESGSYDLPAYIEHLAPQIGTPGLVVCLDSGCGNYEQLWCTTSLRGLIGGKLSIEVLTEGVHSGGAGGVVPSCFRILRLLLDRLEDSATGEIRPADFRREVPPQRIEQAAFMAQVLGEEILPAYPIVTGLQTGDTSATELLLNRTWRPVLEVIGADGLPPTASAGNVLRPQLTAKLSLRLPPALPAERASAKLKELMEADPPYGARVHFEPDWAATGWDAPPLAPWLAQSLAQASRDFFGKPAVYMGEGGTIPFMAMLGERFPQAQFMITGVLGPQSNAHGPNEFLHIPTAKRLSCCVAQVLADCLSKNTN
jgi:acetylornithine deacetylase/succinyl-diaminopimelate desuccinylase-like protein